MRVVASPQTLQTIGNGPLYVWPRKTRCCGGLTTLAAAQAAPEGVDFVRVDENRFALFIPRGLRRPEELHVEARSRGRIDAYWNGCAWLY